MKDLIIIGAGGHGRVVADIAQKLGAYEKIAFLDDGAAKENMGLPVLGKVSEVDNYVTTADICVAIGNSEVREKWIERLLAMGASVPKLIHPNAAVGACVEMGAGTVVMAGAVINPCAKLGKGVIVNTCSSIDHDCAVGDYCHISVGAHVAGTVTIGAHSWLGVGAIVRNNIGICEKCMIGAGAVVVKDITESGTYVGVPAKKF